MMTPEERLRKITVQAAQRIINTGQEESMQLFMEQLQTTELDDAGWSHLLLELLKITPKFSTNTHASLGNATAEQFPALARKDPTPTSFNTSHEAAHWIINQVPKDHSEEYHPLEALWLAFQGIYGPGQATLELKRYGFIVPSK